MLDYRFVRTSGKTFLFLLLFIALLHCGAERAHAIYLHNFACNNCHIAGISLYASGDSNLCVQCHRSGGGITTEDGRSGPATNFSENDLSNAMGTHDALAPTAQTSHTWAALRDVNPAAGAQRATSTLYYSRYMVSTNKVTCTKCHNPHATFNGTPGVNGPLGSNQALRIDNSSDAICLNCHRDWDTAPASALGTHPIGIPLAGPSVKASISDPNVQLVGGNISCSTCHGAHWTDSDAATSDGPGGTAIIGDGKMLVTDGRSVNANTLCQSCHTYQHHGAGKVGCLDCHSGHVYNNGNPNYFVLRAEVTQVESKKAGGPVDLSGINYNSPTTLWKNNGAGYCENCHTLPAGDHNGYTTGGAAECSGCHDHTAGGGAFGGSCNSCHGYAPSTNSAAGPTGYASADLTAEGGGVVDYLTDDGALAKDESQTPHISHSDPLTASSLNHNLGCLECHANFSSTHKNGVFSDVVFNAVAATGTASPTYNRTANGNQGSCSSVYCHSSGNDSNFQTVDWETGRDTIATCSACHGDTGAGMTSAGNTTSHTRHLARFGDNCNLCHSGTAASGNATLVRTGTNNVITADHVNGTADVLFETTFSLGVGTLGSTNDYTVTGNCSAVYCHSNSRGLYVTADWSTGTGGACGDCHNLDAGSGSAMSTGSHTTHINDSDNEVGRNLTCYECHSATVTSAATPTLVAQTTSSKHVDGERTVAIGSEGGAGCSNIKCHSNGNFDTGATYVTNNATWGSTTLGCADCHGNGTVPYPVYASTGAGTADANSHAAHIASGATCNDCHSLTSSAGTSIDGSDGSKHVNQTVDVAGAGIGGWDNVTKTCSTVTCHGGNNPVWGSTSLSCADCHLSASADVDSFSFDGTTANINAAEWNFSGHGLAAASTYELTGRAGADFDAAASGAGASPCFYCHSSGVAHDDGSNYFRLLDNAGQGFADLNGNCLACHGTSGAGIDPDGAGSAYAAKSSSLKVDKYHGGAKHTSATDGGRWCWDCHDPHGDAAAAGARIQMIQRHAAVDPDGFGKPASLTATAIVFTDNTVGAGAGGFARDIAGAAAAEGVCNNCHTATAQYTDATGRGTHPTGKCTSCHEHSADTGYNALAFQGSGCNGCHGGGYDFGGGNAWSENNYWPDDGNANAENDGGRHQKHMAELAQAKYGETLNQLLTDTGNGTADAKQQFLCAYCHTTPGGDGDHGDPANLPAEVNSFYAIWDLARATADNGVYSAAADTCATADCHNNVTTTDNTYGWYDAGTASCAMCHSVNPTTDTTHVAHTGAAASYAVAITCATCHDAATVWGTTPPASGHRDGAWTVTAGYGYGGNWATGAKGSCNTTTCHNNGQATPGAPARVATWGTALSNDCASCHLGSAMANNAHAEHLGSNALGGTNLTFNSTDECITCHTGTTNGSGLASGANHLNGAINLGFASAYNYELGTAGVASGSGATTTCSAVLCHNGATTPQWGSGPGIACGQCHGSGTDPLPTGSIAGSHGLHANADADYTDCRNCHSNALAYAATGGHADHQNLTVNVSFHSSIDPGADNAYGPDLDGAAGVNYAGDGVDDATCATVDCHFNTTTAAWGSAPSAYPDRCDNCHNDGVTDGDDNTLAGAVPAASDGIHKRHVKDGASVYVDDCNACHGANANTAAHAGHSDFATSYGNNLAGYAAGSCTTNLCHDDSAGNLWTDGATLACSDCHSSAKLLDAGGENDLSASIGPDAGEHDAHMGNTAILTGGCVDCHGHNGDFAAAGHADGPDVNTITLAGAGQISAYTPADGTCTNTCHSVVDGRDWTSGTTLACGDCHSSTLSLDGGGENDLSATVGPNAGEHDAHTTASASYMGAASCTTCHGHSGALGNFATTGHVNTTKETDGTNISLYTAADGTCTNLCHSVVDGRDWTSGTTLNCTDCHTTALLLGAGGDATMSGTVAPNSGKHTVHMNNTNYAGDCVDCHSHNGSLAAAGHVNGPSKADIEVANSITVSPIPADDTCTNNCHDVVDGRDWTLGTLVCADCHAANVAKTLGRGAWPPVSNAHAEHSASNALPNASQNDCYACHGGTATSGGVANGANHLNLTAGDLVFDAAFSYEAGSAGVAAGSGATTTCSAVRCHNGATTPQWGSGPGIACGQCHGNGTDPLPTGSIGNAHSLHANNDADYTDCRNCHSNALAYAATGDSGVGTHQNLTVNVSFHSSIDPTADNAYSDGDGAAGINYAGDFTDDGTCSNVECHSNTLTPAWNAAASPYPNRCVVCHNDGDGGTTLSDAVPAATKGIHKRHVDDGASAYVDDCNACHGAGASNGSHTGHSNLATTYGNSLAGYSAGSCTTNLCHNDAAGNLWADGSTLVCSDCHSSTKTLDGGGESDLSPAVGPNAGEHDAHMAQDGAQGNYVPNGCSDCHGHSGDFASAGHADAAATITVASQVSVYTPAAGTCTNTCHAVTDGRDWTSGTTLDCADCHDAAAKTLFRDRTSGSHPAHVDTASAPAAGDYGSTTNASTVASYDFGCGECHPAVEATDHLQGGAVQVAAGVGYNVSNQCTTAYCHSSGQAVPSYATSPAWGGSFAGDKCAGCHGNSPATGAHAAHNVGIHYDSLYTGGTGLMNAGNTTTSAHGNAGTATTINCHVCHNATVTSSANDQNTVCISCHDGGTAPLQGDATIADKSVHVNGARNVAFATGSIASKAQLRNDITSVASLNTTWTRNIGYKTAGAFDGANSVTPASYAAGSCSAIVCHNGANATWSTPTGDCTKCHTELP